VIGNTELNGRLTVSGSTLHVNPIGAPVNPGRVGIGTASPSAKLDVVGDTELNGNLTVDTDTFSVDSVNNRVGIGTASPTEALQMNGGFVYINGESGGFIVDAANLKRVGFLKYSNHEAGIWRIPGQDFEIGRVTIPDNPATPLVDESTILPGSPSSWTTDLYIDGDGDVGIGIGDGANAGTDLARKLHINDVMRLEPRTSPPTSPSLGDIYVDSSGALCFYSSAWHKAAPTSPGTCS
jgi:hypothetical protein